MKLIWLLVAAALACKWLIGRWPWQVLGPMMALSARKADAARAAALLGVTAGASREAIIEAHKALLIRVHPDRGGSEALVHEANAARDVLLAARAVGERDG